MNEMMRELYQETIMGHNKRPKNFRAIEDADTQADGHNPLCGDRLTVFVDLEGDTVQDVAFVGDGCAISKASASLMTEAVKGKDRDEATAMYEAFHRLVTREAPKEGDEERLGKLKVFAGVGEFPARVKCAALPWRTLAAALEGKDATTTE